MRLEYWAFFNISYCTAASKLLQKFTIVTRNTVDCVLMYTSNADTQLLLLNDHNSNRFITLW